MSRVKQRTAPLRHHAPIVHEIAADDSESDAEQAPLNLPVDIGPAWLLLSHGAFLAAIGVGSSAAFQFLLANPAHANNSTKALAIVQAVGSIIIGSWTIYAINGTWRENRKLAQPLYGDGGFVALILIVSYLMATAVVIIVFAAVYPVP